MIEHAGYTGVFEYDPELEMFSGHVVDVRDVIYFEGASVEELKASMIRAVDAYLALCAEQGDEPEKPFSGNLRVRMGTELHRNATVAAAAAGVSLNTLIVKALEERVGTEGGSR